MIELIAPPPEQIARGFKPGFVMDDDGRQNMAYRNLGYDPVERWLEAGRLSPIQKTAIDTVRRLWGILGVSQRTTANYGERIAGACGGEHMTAVYLDAKQDLARIEGYFAGVKPYWAIFQNVCRFGQSSGAAGEEHGFSPKAAQVKALVTVRFVADFIAAKEGLQ